MQNQTPAIPDAEIQAVIDKELHLEAPLLPILHAIQITFGHIPDNAVLLVGAAMNITKAEVHGVMSFYHDFRREPAGRHVLRICRAEACQSMGGKALADETLKLLGLDWHGTTANGAVTVEPVYCLGMCACAPAAMVDDKVVGRVDKARMDKLLQEAGA